MAKNLLDNLDNNEERNPLEMRTPIKPVNMFDNETYSSNERANGSVVREPVLPSQSNTNEENKKKKGNDLKLITELSEEAPSVRKTERYSFEVYTDQKFRIEEIQYLYRKKSGGKKKLSASRLIRDILDIHLKKLVDELSS